jgi:hypothetical protein
VLMMRREIWIHTTFWQHNPLFSDCTPEMVQWRTSEYATKISARSESGVSS